MKFSGKSAFHALRKIASDWRENGDSSTDTKRTKLPCVLHREARLLGELPQDRRPLTADCKPQPGGNAHQARRTMKIGWERTAKILQLTGEPG